MSANWSHPKLDLSLRNPALGPAAARLAADIAAKHVKPPAIEMILANILAESESFLRFSRTRDDYRVRRYHAFTREHVVQSIEGLVRLGYLQEIQGGFEQQNTIHATQGLLDLLAEISTSVAQNHFQEVIVLKGFDPKSGEEIEIEIEYDDTDETRRMRADLLAYNAFMSEHEVRDINGRRHATHLVRIFNRRKFRFGGRFYRASYQNLNKELRRSLTIDGESVVEWDYSGLHPRLLYHLAGHEAPEDPYQIDNLDGVGRSQIKSAVNTALNAADFEEAAHAFAQKKLDGNLDLARRVLDAILAAHPLIQKHFFSSAGRWLMRLDSDIANEILKDFVAARRPILVEHDSFLVQAEDEERLVETMKTAYRQANPKGFEPIASKK